MNEAHERIDNPLTEEEKGNRDATAIRSIVANLVAEAKQEWLSEVASELDDFRAPVRKAPEMVNRSGEAVTRLASPYQHLYDAMPENVRKYRTPDTDHWSAEWIRGMTFKNFGQMMHANAELEKLGFGRATTAEGVAAASGALSTGTGGPIIPRPLEAVILVSRDANAKMRRFAQRFTMTAQTHTIPTAGAMTAYMAGESTTATQGEPTLTSVQLTAKKGQVKAVATVEVLQDAAINLINLWSVRGGRALAALEDQQFFKLGDGTGNNISAFLSGTGYSENTSGILAFMDVLGMYYTLGQQYRSGAVWLIDPTTLQSIAMLRNATTGTQFYLGLTEKPGPITDDPTAEGTILRRPVYEVPFTAGTVWFGDPSAAYMVGDRAGMQAQVSDQVRFETDEVVWKITQRFDGQNIDAAASQVATGITSVTDAIA